MNRRLLQDCEQFLFRFQEWQEAIMHLPEATQAQHFAMMEDLVFQMELLGWQFDPPESFCITAKQAASLMSNPCAEIALGTVEPCNISVFMPEWWANETLAQLYENMSANLALNIDKMILGVKP